MDKLIAIIVALAFVAVIFCAWSCAGYLAEILF